MASLAGKVAVVTGASSGIGWALAKALVAEGCKVGLIARREEQLKTLAAEITAEGGTAAVAPTDVGNQDAVDAGITSVRTALGPIDLMIANAGFGRPTMLDPVNMADIETTFRGNVLGVVYSISAVLPEMLSRKCGRVVAISSLAGYRGLPGESAYCASKAAVNAYMDGLRIHLRGTGVSALTVCPGFVTTPMTAKMDPREMPGLMTADAAAKRILRAIKAGKKVYNFPWHVYLLTRFSRWAPDSVVNWVMGNYNENAKKQVLEVP